MMHEQDTDGSGLQGAWAQGCWRDTACLGMIRTCLKDREIGTQRELGEDAFAGEGTGGRARKGEALQGPRIEQRWPGDQHQPTTVVLWST